MILDVGCGSIPRGDVNLDLMISGSDYRARVDPKTTKNFIKGSILQLPFPDNSFRVVFCSHLLEHLENPDQAISELLRVSSRYVIIRVPFFLFEIVSWLLKPWKFFWMRKHHKQHYFSRPFGKRASLRFISLKMAALNRVAYEGSLKFPIPFESETVIEKS